jgi:hypothetical protein
VWVAKKMRWTALAVFSGKDKRKFCFVVATIVGAGLQQQQKQLLTCFFHHTINSLQANRG